MKHFNSAFKIFKESLNKNNIIIDVVFSNQTQFMGVEKTKFGSYILHCNNESLKDLNLTEDELIAIMYHEYAYIFYNDFSFFSYHFMLINFYIMSFFVLELLPLVMLTHLYINDIGKSQEYRADIFATENIPHEDFISALIKIREYYLKHQKNNYLLFKKYNLFFSYPSVEKRIINIYKKHNIKQENNFDQSKN